MSTGLRFYSSGIRSREWPDRPRIKHAKEARCLVVVVPDVLGDLESSRLLVAVVVRRQHGTN